LIVILIPLTRIDAAVMVFGFSCYYLIKKDFTKFGAMNAALLIGMALYFMINKSIAGSWFSVSALIKGSETSLNTDLLVENLIKGGLGYTLRAAVLFLLAGSSVYLIASRLVQKRNQILLWAFIGAALFSFGHLYFSWLRAWYYVPGHVIFAYLFFRADPRTENCFRWIKRGTILVLFISIAGYLVVRIDDYFKGKEEAKCVRNFISDIEKYVPEGEMIFQRDGAGYTGYYSKRAIMNGDGLVNDHAYAELVITKKLGGYLDQHNIQYIISNLPLKGDVIDDYCGLKIRLQDVDVLLEKKNNGGNRFSNFVLYRKKPVKANRED
jgi:hypothetical protein